MYSITSTTKNSPKRAFRGFFFSFRYRIVLVFFWLPLLTVIVLLILQKIKAVMNANCYQLLGTFKFLTHSYSWRLNRRNTLKKFWRTIIFIDLSIWNFKRSLYFLSFVNDWSHRTNVKWFYLSENFIFFTFSQKNYRITLNLSLILNKNDWNSKLIFYPFWNSRCKIHLMTWVIKEFINTFHYDFIEKRFRIHFFNERGL